MSFKKGIIGKIRNLWPFHFHPSTKNIGVSKRIFWNGLPFFNSFENSNKNQALL
jgi:hypothetical protein